MNRAILAVLLAACSNEPDPYVGDWHVMAAACVAPDSVGYNGSAHSAQVWDLSIAKSGRRTYDVGWVTDAGETPIPLECVETEFGASLGELPFSGAPRAEEGLDCGPLHADAGEPLVTIERWFESNLVSLQVYADGEQCEALYNPVAP